MADAWRCRCSQLQFKTATMPPLKAPQARFPFVKKVFAYRRLFW
jgi:hypothetical protein